MQRSQSPVTGLYVYRGRSPADTVTTKSGTFRLLATHSDVEIHEGTLARGKQLNLVPFEAAEDGATELYYILSGTMRAALPSGVITVGRGDLIATSALGGPVIFETLEEVQFLYVSTKATFDQVSSNLNELTRLAAVVDLRDGFSAGHSLRIQKLALATGHELHLSQERLYSLEYGSYLHDVGKCRIPLAILTKRGSLDEQEWTEMKRHPVYGMEMLSRTFLRGAASIVEQHHERLDGSGYPRGLRAGDILPEALIVGIADTFDSLTSDRPWRPAVPRDRALQVLDEAADVLFPRTLLKAFRVAELRLPGP